MNKAKVNSLLNEIRTCQKCDLSKERNNVVPGEGSFEAEVMFIGEAPGKKEDLLARPFIGAAGRILTELIEAIGLSREEVYITNVVKCRPPANRDPLTKEVSCCWPYLEMQIRLIKPKLIVTLGRHSMNRFLDGLKISEVHGQMKCAKGVCLESQVYLPLYHPAVALYDSRKKAVLMDDFRKIPLILKKLK